MNRPELDRHTLARACRGDDAACRAFVVRYERLIFAILGRMMGATDPAAVEDLAQETFLRAFRALHRFDADGEARLSTWLCTIATRLAIDALRKRRPRVGLPRGLGERAGDLRADATVERAELAQRIRAALETLPPDQRAVVLLRACDGLSYAEIAERLSCSPGTVASRLGRARATLRGLLGGVR